MVVLGCLQDLNDRIFHIQCLGVDFHLKLTCTDEDEFLGQESTLLAGQINAANHRLWKLIARFDRREAWCGGGTVRSCAHWLNWKCGIALGAAGRLAAPKPGG
jgi:hypothetical protein